MSKTLIHEDYDPVKAHEYYLKVRELKGRKEAADSTDSDIKWTTDKTAPTESAKVSEAPAPAAASVSVTSPKTEALKAKGTALRNKLADKGQSESGKQNAKYIAERLNLEKEKQAKLDAVPPGPNRDREMIKIIREYDAKFEKIYAAQQVTPKTVTKSKSTKKKAALSALKEKVADAKDSYDEAQKRIREKYEKEQAEQSKKLLKESQYKKWGITNEKY